MELTKKNDFVELKYTGYSQGQVFDSNATDDLKKLNPEAKAEKLVVVIGQGMVVPGLDKTLEGKEIEKEYEIKISAKEGFGERDRNLMKTIPLRAFTEKNINPRPGQVLALDNMIAKIVSISGARVLTDFNNPMAGKELNYKFKIIRKVDDEKEKCQAVFSLLFRFVPEFEVKDSKVIVKGPNVLEDYIKASSGKFNELIGRELEFELKEEKENKEEKDEHEHAEHNHEHAHEHK